MPVRLGLTFMTLCCRKVNVRIPSLCGSPTSQSVSVEVELWKPIVVNWPSGSVLMKDRPRLPQ